MNNGVVIVTYNRMELLKECLACVCGQTIPFSRVIVVNNCSTDGTGAYLQSREDAIVLSPDTIMCSDDVSDGREAKRIWVIDETENLGGAGGFYHGLQVARTMDLDWVLVIDDDAMIAPDYMERLLEGRTAQLTAGKREVAALAGSVWTEDRLDLSHRRRITNRLLFVESAVEQEEYRSAFSCDCATFCGLAIAGSKMQEIGLPQKDYFLWYDDTEYCLRLQDCGGITVIPDARLDHKTTLSKEGMVAKGVLHRIGWRQYYGYRNRYDTARAHLGKGSARCILWQYRVFLLLSRCMMLKKSTRAQGASNVRILRDVIQDCKSGRLGRHPSYHY